MQSISSTDSTPEESLSYKSKANKSANSSEKVSDLQNMTVQIFLTHLRWQDSVCNNSKVIKQIPENQFLPNRLHQKLRIRGMKKWFFRHPSMPTAQVVQLFHYCQHQPCGKLGTIFQCPFSLTSMFQIDLSKQQAAHCHRHHKMKSSSPLLLQQCKTSFVLKMASIQVNLLKFRQRMRRWFRSKNQNGHTKMSNSWSHKNLKSSLETEI